MKKFVTLFLAVLVILQSFLITGLAADADNGVGSEVQDTFSGYTTRALQEGEVVRYGLDVSEYQRSIDWNTLADNGIDFAFIRIGYRSYGSGALNEDSLWQENVQNAEAAGLKVGVYFYSQAISEAEGIEEADYVLGLLGDTMLSLPVVIDYEFADNGSGRLYQAGLSREGHTAVCNAFCSEVEAYGYDAAVYANEYMLTSRMNASDLTGSVWLSNVTRETSYSGDYDFWQCSYSGWLPGVSSSVDIDIWLDDGQFTDCEPEPEPEALFEDVSEADWSYGAISWCVENGILDQSEASFRPTENISKMDMITMLYLCSGAQAAASADTDLSTQAAAWVSSTGILKGNKQNLWAQQTLPRQELLRMLYRMAGSPAVTVTGLSAYSDGSKVGTYYRDAVQWALNTGILCGDSDGILNPTGLVSRETAAVFVYRYCQLAA